MLVRIDMVFFIKVCVFGLLFVVIMVLVFLFLIGKVWLRWDLIWFNKGLCIGVINVFLLVLKVVLLRFVGLNIGYIFDGFIGEVFMCIIILWVFGFGIFIFFSDIWSLFFDVISVNSCLDLFILVFVF